jgi:long-chain fatty acid transport protein
MIRGLICLTLIAGSLLVSHAWAGGLWFYEMGTPDLGTAGAGRAALAADASTAGINPAGMTRLERSQMLAAFQGIYLDAKFDTDVSGFGGGDGGNAGEFTPAGSLHYVHRVTDDLRLGIATGSNFGLALDYDDDWAGRYYSTKADLFTFSINPVAAYRINNWLSVGAGLNVLYASLDQEAAINNQVTDPGFSDGKIKFEDEDVAYGFNLGILVSPWSGGSRFGLSYRSELDLEFFEM